MQKRVKLRELEKTVKEQEQQENTKMQKREQLVDGRYADWLITLAESKLIG